MANMNEGNYKREFDARFTKQRVRTKGDPMLAKCDVRLDRDENDMLNYLADIGGDTRSGVLRKALLNYYYFNTEKEFK